VLALIDGDIVVYRIGYTTERDDWWIARWRCDDMLERMLSEIDASEFRVYLSDSTNNGFRKSILPSYKANRVQPRPKHYDALKEHLLTHWNARITVGEEADDRLGIDQSTQLLKNLTRDNNEEWVDSVICSIDKDLHQITGKHYNFVKNEWTEITSQYGEWFFWRQVLTGDTADNIKGVYGIGPKKAEKILSKVVDPRDYFQAVFETYCKVGKISEEEATCRILINGRVLKIRTREGEIWNFPKDFASLQPTEEYLLSYIQRKEEENVPSTVPTMQAKEHGSLALGSLPEDGTQMIEPCST